MGRWKRHKQHTILSLMYVHILKSIVILLLARKKQLITLFQGDKLLWTLDKLSVHPVWVKKCNNTIFKQFWRLAYRSRSRIYLIMFEPDHVRLIFLWISSIVKLYHFLTFDILHIIDYFHFLLDIFLTCQDEYQLAQISHAPPFILIPFLKNVSACPTCLWAKFPYHARADEC